MTSLGRYTLYAKIAQGGMATVHFARLAGEAGFTRTVAVKRLHRHLAADPAFGTMFLDEARLAARIRHPNVVATIDVEQVEDEIFVVMDYVHGEPLARLIRFVAGAVEKIPFGVISAIMTNVLQGLHAAHEARDNKGAPLELVHRDVSPQNILVGTDGVARVIDFGVAKARGRVQTTRDGRVKGKLAYMSPEQLRGERIDRRTDIYAAGVILWELLTLVRLFGNDSDATTIENALQRKIEPPSAFAADVPPALDAVVMRALARDPADRFDTAKQMAAALEEAMPVATQATVGEWVEATAKSPLEKRSQILADIERATTLMAPIFPEPSKLAPKGKRHWSRSIGALLFAFGAVFALRALVARTPVAPPAPAPPPTLVASAASPTPSASATLPEPADSEAAGPAHGHLVRRRRPASHAGKCDPPYTVGSDGIRRYKLDCLH